LSALLPISGKASAVVDIPGSILMTINRNVAGLPHEASFGENSFSSGSELIKQSVRLLDGFSAITE
jgi:hypothetical protein